MLSTSLPLILASCSSYRQRLLATLMLPFTVVSPNCDETALAQENAAATAQRLARLKALSVQQQFPRALIIGADQVAELGQQQLGKPGNYQRAYQQLQQMRAQTVTFHSGLCLYNSHTKHCQCCVVPYQVTMRHYSDAEISAYLQKEAAYDCVGSARIEQLGISLVASMHGSDPNALIGLPLIALLTMLRQEGVSPL